ncbi:MAG TPA: DUF6384 family protein [Gammaproteobacteria bacterium]
MAAMTTPGGPPAPRAAEDQAPLDEVMLAMDVVDTLRHRERLIERELGAEDRERQLKERLREIYAGQGIEVSDAVIEQGVRALRENRFVYQPAEPGLRRSLAVLYVTRDRWGKWVGAGVAAVAAVLLTYQLAIRGPALREIEELPHRLEAAEQAVLDVAIVPEAEAEARSLAAEGDAALGRGDYDDAREAVAELGALRARLEQQYELRIVSRPGELSGVWRIPEDNPSAQNYYLIVEAVAPDGSVVGLPVENEETGETETVTRFGLRVDEATFNRVREDKSDDGIIQNNVVGVKRRGELEREYLVETTGATITEW